MDSTQNGLCNLTCKNIEIMYHTIKQSLINPNLMLIFYNLLFTRVSEKRKQT